MSEEKKFIFILILILISGIPVKSDFTVFPEDAETAGTESSFKFLSDNEILLAAMGAETEDARSQIKNQIFSSVFKLNLF
jgi:hypothetical protein